MVMNVKRIFNAQLIFMPAAFVIMDSAIAQKDIIISTDIVSNHQVGISIKLVSKHNNSLSGEIHKNKRIRFIDNLVVHQHYNSPRIIILIQCYHGSI